MAKRTLFKNTFYHIHNSGHDKQKLFFKDEDFERFIQNIGRYHQQFPNIYIYAYCILPKHFHILIYEKETTKSLATTQDKEKPQLIPSQENRTIANISTFMNRLQQSYAVYFNHHYKKKTKSSRPSPVFNGRFLSQEIQDKNYLPEIQNLIEQNSVKHKYVKNAKEWPYSSFDPSSPAIISKNKNINLPFDS